MTILDAIEFCVTQGGKAFEGWPLKTIADLIHWHAKKQTLVVIEDEGRIAGVLAYSRLPEQPESPDMQRLAWAKDDPKGPVIYWTAIVGNAQKILRAMAVAFTSKVPDWRETQIWAHRDGRLVHYSHRFVEKLLKP